MKAMWGIHRYHATESRPIRPQEEIYRAPGWAPLLSMGRAARMPRCGVLSATGLGLANG